MSIPAFDTRSKLQEIAATHKEIQKISGKISQITNAGQESIIKLLQGQLFSLRQSFDRSVEIYTNNEGNIYALEAVLFGENSSW